MAKIFQLILCCCLIGVSFGKSEEEIKAYFMKLGIQCSREHNITPDEMVMMQKHKLPDSENSHCLMACVYKKANWVILLENIDWIIHPIVNPDRYEYTHTDMNDKGMFDMDAAQAMAEKDHGEDTSMVEKSKKLFETCKAVNDETVKDGEKGCDRAAHLFKCLTENALKMGFKI